MKMERIWIAKCVGGCRSTTTEESGEWRAWGDCGDGRRRRPVGPRSFLDCRVPTKISTIATARRASFVFCVFVGKVAFSFPRRTLAFSFFIVCRRLVVFSLFFRRHCKHASGVLRGFFSRAVVRGFLASVSPLSITFAVGSVETSAST